MKKIFPLILILLLLTSVFAGCGSKDDKDTESSGNQTVQDTSDNKDSNEDDNTNGEATIKGDITVLTNRTDIVDTVFEEYKKAFNNIYPEVRVSFEAITDYEGQVKIRMNTEDYGDVLLIPNDVPVQDLPDFYEPLGTQDALSKDYLFTEEKAYDGTVYGIPVVVNAQGILYNKKVFEQAGVTTLPKTPKEFLDAMRKIKDNTEAIPYYTNYAAGWTMNQWEPHRTSVAGDSDYVNSMIHIDDPFGPEKPHYQVYRLLYDLVKEGLVEIDPMTTDWELSKQWIADGKIGAMVLGSWAIVQAQELAANPDDIGYMPFPYTNDDGKIYAASGGDYKIGINKNSKNKEAAKAWLDWFINESGFAIDQGGISPVIGVEFPTTLSAYQELGVELISNNPPSAEEQGLLDQVDQEAEIGFWQPDYKQRIIEAALGNRSESFDDIMNDLNKKWAKARTEIIQ